MADRCIVAPFRKPGGGIYLPGRVFSVPGQGIRRAALYPARVLRFLAGERTEVTLVKVQPFALPAFPARCRFPGAAVSAAIGPGGSAERQGWMSAAVTGMASSPGLREVELSVRGMTCAACAARVEKKLNAPGRCRRDGEFRDREGDRHRARVGSGRAADRGGRAGRLRRGAGAAPGGRAARRGGGAGRRQPGWPDLRRRLIVALVFFVPLSDLSVLLSLFPWSRFPGWQWVLVALAAPVAGWAAWPFHAAALKNARHGAASMDTLVSLGITAACGWSVYAMFVLDHGQAGISARQLLLHASGGGIYLEVAASVTTFLLAGRWYEARARRDAGDAMRELAAAGAREACVLAGDGTERRVPVGQLRPGDRFVVRPGEVIAADGVVEFGESAVDTSMMTGESVPADVAVGGTVTAGTVVVSGRLVVRAAQTGEDTQLAHLIALVEQAQAEKSRIQRLADRICGVFVPVVLAAAAADAGRLAGRGQPGRAGVQRRAGRADHRLPVRAGPGHSGRAGGGLRAGRAAGHLHQGLPGAGVLPGGGHRRAGQDRDGHHRGDGRDRGAARARHQPRGAAAAPRRGRAGLRAPGRRGDQRRRARRAGAAAAG